MILRDTTFHDNSWALSTQPRGGYQCGPYNILEKKKTAAGAKAPTAAKRR
jgi:hypothetical protein